MKAHIRYIGVVDKAGMTHAVPFSPGVNVVTGRSSTGKSALIEIFDFCFGCDDFTIPEGVITERAAIYFSILSVRNSNVILARRRDETKAFLKEVSDLNFTSPLSLAADFFEPAFFLTLSEFKKELGRYFGIQVTDPGEDSAKREWTGRKANAPSVRSLTSFLLQHQNLVANKHAVFYRFDEKEKREQVIEHFKIFVGLVDQTYFIKSQRLNELIANQRRLEILIPKAVDVRKKVGEEIEAALTAYLTTSGVPLNLGSTDAIVRNPSVALQKLRETPLTVIPSSNAHAQERRLIEERMAGLTAKLRQKHNKLSEIRSSISFAKSYNVASDRAPVPTETVIQASVCPFCRTDHSAVENEANKLLSAINWLNQELERSPYLLESFLEAEKKEQREVDILQEELKKNQQLIELLDKQIAELARFKSQYELSLRARYQLEMILINLTDGKDVQLEKELDATKKEITSIRHFLKANYDLEAKLEVAQSTIRDLMAKIGAAFEFEPSYRPIKLDFSLSTFELWHNGPERKIFLRAMGSGANWLYSHVTLFLALHRYFCSLGDRCSIPSILFFDQPSQVYFPSSLDSASAFNAAELVEKEGKVRSRPVDVDLAAVSNLYDQLVAFCQDVGKDTGITPQIIVTDHADHLTLKNGQPFDDLVQGRRWRTHGFIADAPAASGSNG